MSDGPIYYESVREQVRHWIQQERKLYADVKYAEDGANREMLKQSMRDEGLSGKWLDFAGNYLKRAELLGVQTPHGRQALGKTIVTLIHCLETAVEIHGPTPLPGVASGEVAEL